MSGELKGVYAQRNSPINVLCNWAYDLNSKSKFTAEEHVLYQNTSHWYPTLNLNSKLEHYN